MKKQFFLLAALALAVAGLALAQTDKSKRPSPPATTEYKFADGKSVKIDYSSPRMKGRKIFGAVLVPYGKIWRTGANEATSFVTTANLTIGGKAVPAGSYTLFTIPNEKSWTLILSKKTGEWGTDYPGEAEDLLRVEMQVSATAAPVETFTIALDGTGPKSATLRLEWESTSATVAIAQP
ncbi:MAG: DUF2911 domain-containing protein [Acidobacteriia bacterium]|nr:DUF2911 domain-containing protein [Terriglobia bacterium]